MTLKDLTPEQYSTYVGLLTETDKDLLIGQWYMDDSYFNPIQDNDDRWVISIEEISQCVNPDFSWVQNLPLIPYVPKPAPFFKTE
jgi:succinate dehydrogenase flavin-adding protein (antitoxin of CptAB toxin-antitoxin module)